MPDNPTDDEEPPGEDDEEPRMVHHHPEFQDLASFRFPEGGGGTDDDPTPPLRMFLEGPVRAAEFIFGTKFESTTDIGGGVRRWPTDPNQFVFPPIDFFARERDDGTRDVELVWFEVLRDTYLEDLWANDPDPDQ